MQRNIVENEKAEKSYQKPSKDIYKTDQIEENHNK